MYWLIVHIERINNHNYLIPESNVSSIKGFDTHRHDQAILSCLLKSNSKQSVKIGDKFNDGCIRAVRHRFGYRYENPNFKSIVFYKIIALISRFKLALERRIFKNALYLRPKPHLNFLFNIIFLNIIIDKNIHITALNLYKFHSLNYYL